MESLGAMKKGEIDTPALLIDRAALLMYTHPLPRLAFSAAVEIEVSLAQDSEFALQNIQLSIVMLEPSDHQILIVTGNRRRVVGQHDSEAIAEDPFGVREVPDDLPYRPGTGPWPFCGEIIGDSGQASIQFRRRVLKHDQSVLST